MIVPSTRIFTAGEVETGAYLNSAVTNLGNFMLGRPIAALRQTVAQTFTTGVGSTITFDTEDIDRDNGHSLTTNTDRYTAQTAGWYWVSGSVSFVGNATGTRSAALYKNGTILNTSQNRVFVNAATNALVPTSALVYLALNDYITIQGNQNSGGNLNSVVTAGTQSCLQLVWVSL